jgi:uncharacterized integral membrane protein
MKVYVVRRGNKAVAVPINNMWDKRGEAKVYSASPAKRRAWYMVYYGTILLVVIVALLIAINWQYIGQPVMDMLSNAHMPAWLETLINKGDFWAAIGVR